MLILLKVLKSNLAPSFDTGLLPIIINATRGGGNPYIGKLMALSMIKKNGPVTLLSPEEAPDEELFVSASGIGAPAVSMEKFPNGSEFRRSFEMMESYYAKKSMVLFQLRQEE